MALLGDIMPSHSALLDDLNRQTAKIAWHSLQPYFAQGQVLFVAANLDLIEVAAMIASDQKAPVAELMQQKTLHKVTDAQALTWFEQQAKLWAVVIDPWVVVQEIKE